VEISLSAWTILTFVIEILRFAQNDRGGAQRQRVRSEHQRGSEWLDFAEELLKEGVIRANTGDVLHGFPSSGVAVSQGFVIFLFG